MDKEHLPQDDIGALMRTFIISLTLATFAICSLRVSIQHCRKASM